MVPDIPTFALEDGFDYRVPPPLIERVTVGTLVRVPLGARRVRGYVIGVGAAHEASDEARLKDVRTVSSDIPVFSESMLPSLLWAAEHYVAPLARLLAKTAPPNLPKRPVPVELPSVPPADGPIPDVSEAAARGGSSRPVQVLAGDRWSEVIRGIITPPVRAEKSVLIVAPTAVEAALLAERLEVDLGRRVISVADQDDATITAAWSRAATQRGLVVVGTMRVMWWPVKVLSMMVLVEDGRRGMKERKTPTVAANALARVRWAGEGLQLVLMGRVPTVHTLHEGSKTARVPGRLWGPVEIVDRTEDPPGGELLAGRVRVAIASAVRQGGRVFVFTHRRGYAPAARCVACRSLRSCPACGARPDHRPVCSRCQAKLGGCSSCGGNRFEPLGAGIGRVLEELRRVVGDKVGEVGSGCPAMVGTERDLVAVPRVDLAVVVDADGLVRGTNYRATEDALSMFARVAGAVRRRGRSRMMLQTADIHHPVYAALRRGDPSPFLTDELVARRRFSLPPCGEVMVVEVQGGDDLSILDQALEGVTVYGPARNADRIRWMVQGEDLWEVKDRLRQTIGRMRDQGLKVRVDVDPREF